MTTTSAGSGPGIRTGWAAAVGTTRTPTTGSTTASTTISPATTGASATPTSPPTRPGPPARRRWGSGLGRRHRFDPTQIGWRLGRAREPRGKDLWVPWDRTAGTIGPQGSGKTLDLLIPALLGAPGPALVTLTKVEDLLLSYTTRAARGPVAVLDPFGLAPGLPELVWDPVAGCVDAMTAERRAKAFTAGTIKGALAEGQMDTAARFYAAEAAKVLQAYLHAAALTVGCMNPSGVGVQ